MVVVARDGHHASLQSLSAAQSSAAPEHQCRSQPERQRGWHTTRETAQSSAGSLITSLRERETTEDLPLRESLSIMSLRQIPIHSLKAIVPMGIAWRGGILHSLTEPTDTESV